MAYADDLFEELAELLQTCERNDGSTINESNVGTSNTIRNNPEFMENFWSNNVEPTINEQQSTSIMARFSKLRCEGYILHDILRGRGNITNTDIVETILRRYEDTGYNGRVLWISRHDGEGWDHIHVVHDCKYTNKWCRCKIFDGLAFKRRNTANIKLSSDATAEYWYNLSIYLHSSPRKIVLFHIRNNFGRPVGSHEIDSLLRDTRWSNRSTTILDACNKGNEICNSGYTEESTDGPNSSIDQSNRGGNFARFENKNGGKKQKILQFFFEHPTSPILSIVKTKQWLNSAFAELGRNNETFKNCCDIFCRKICNFTLEDFAKLYNNSSPIFGALSGNVEEEYYSITESLIQLENFLLYQFVTIDAVRDFLDIIYLHLNKKTGKKNCIQICGPPSSGKTYFINIISSFVLSKGQIRNFNKYDNFPLNDCIDKRILIWDEPNYERSAIEQIKLLFSGDKCPANVKYESQVQIDRTPIYVTANADIFPTSEEFQCRMFRFNWQSFPNKTLDVKQIYPLAFYQILLKYGIIN